MKIDEKGNLALNLEEICNALSEEEKKKFVKLMSISPEIIKWVMDWICGEDEDGWWTTEHPLREDLLARAESSQIGKEVTKYNWTLIKEAANKLKHSISEQHIYYKLYDANPEMTVRKFLETSDIQVNNPYQTKLAEKKIQEVIDIVREAVKKKTA